MVNEHVAQKIYKGDKFILEVDQDYVKHALPEGYREVGVINYSYLEEKIRDNSFSLTEDYSTFYDALLGCKVYADPDNQNFVYLNYHGSFIVCEDYIAQGTWIIYNNNLYLYCDEHQNINEWYDSDLEAPAAYYYWDHNISLLDRKYIGAIKNLNQIELPANHDYIPKRNSVSNLDFEYSIASVSASGDTLYTCAKNNCELDQANYWIPWIRIPENYYDLKDLN